MRNIFRKANIGILLYMAINLLLLQFLFAPFLLKRFGDYAYAIVAAAYFSLVGFAISPIGEAILRIASGARRMRRMDWISQYVQPFHQVLEAARMVDRTIPDNVRLYYANDSVPNSFAIGRHSLCITTGLMGYPDEEIRAVMAHELGHISNRDTQVIQLVTVGNILVGALIAVIQLLRILMSVICFAFSFCLGGRIALVLIQIVTWIPMQILRVIVSVSMFFVNLSRRSSEYDADAFSVRSGYGTALIAALDGVGQYPTGRLTLRQILNRTHPDTNERIARIQQQDLMIHSNQNDSAATRILGVNAHLSPIHPVSTGFLPAAQDMPRCGIQSVERLKAVSSEQRFANGRIILH